MRLPALVCIFAVAAFPARAAGEQTDSSASSERVVFLPAGAQSPVPFAKLGAMAAGISFTDSRRTARSYPARDR